ncbi:MAG TPA: protein-L-isoaspartate(D-aspartate) O-methyltransferase [Gaiellaceae bacterium]|nr:protein-L-isoaspartate(D-aspartate) O-methyltransferase [Gaiellaceae bacterium]
MSEPEWVDRQLRRRGIVDERVLAAMGAVPRDRFVPAEARVHAYEDAALAIGHGQSISQPYIVACICQALSLTGDESVLDVGTGSGYQAAVLAELAGSVVSIERVGELADDARATLAATGYERVEVVVGDGSLGLPELAPFDAIAVAAAAPAPPPSLVEQLAPGGRLVVPLGGRRKQRLTLLERTAGGIVARPLVDVRFVPLHGVEGVG